MRRLWQKLSLMHGVSFYFQVIHKFLFYYKCHILVASIHPIFLCLLEKCSFRLLGMWQWGVVWPFPLRKLPLFVSMAYIFILFPVHHDVYFERHFPMGRKTNAFWNINTIFYLCKDFCFLSLSLSTASFDQSVFKNIQCLGHLLMNEGGPSLGRVSEDFLISLSDKGLSWIWW